MKQRTFSPARVSHTSPKSTSACSPGACVCGTNACSVRRPASAWICGRRRYDQVERIRDRFEAMNPYDRTAIPGNILKSEVDATCLAIAAKRYALYRPDQHGHPRLVPADEHDACRHGLGHLLNPVDPDIDPDNGSWINQLWEHRITRYLNLGVYADPDWYRRPALARIAAASPRLLHTFDKLNAGKPYRQQVKPFNFLSFVPGGQPAPGTTSGQPVRLVAPPVSASQAPAHQLDQHPRPRAAGPPRRRRMRTRGSPCSYLRQHRQRLGTPRSQTLRPRRHALPPPLPRPTRASSPHAPPPGARGEGSKQARRTDQRRAHRGGR